MEINSEIPLANTPLEIADLIKDIIQDKIVCDIGCGEGDFMVAMSKYAKKVIGIEEIKERADKAKMKGFEVIKDNSFHNPLPQADVYYSWTRDSMGVYLKAKEEGTKGIFIFGITERISPKAFIKTLNPEIRQTNNGWRIYICQL